MDALYERGKATAAEIHEAIPDAPGNSAVRKLIMILEQKGYVKHERNGKQFIYSPTVPQQRAAKGALKNVLKVFFGGSVENALTTLLRSDEAKVSDDELARIEKMIQEARKEGKGK